MKTPLLLFVCCLGLFDDGRVVLTAPAPVYRKKWTPTPVDGKWDMTWMSSEVWDAEFTEGVFYAQRFGVPERGTYAWDDKARKLTVTVTSYYGEARNRTWSVVLDENLRGRGDSGGLYLELWLRPRRDPDAAKSDAEHELEIQIGW